MKHFQLAILLLSLASCKRAQIQSSENTAVTGVVYEIESYCGGAAPSQELLQQVQSPNPLARKKIFIKNGVENNPQLPVLKEITSNERGEFTVQLPPGYYIIVDAQKVDNSSYDYMIKNFQKETEDYSAVDTECLEEWIKTPDIAFTVTAGEPVKVEVTFKKPCSWEALPCVIYKGQRPY